MLKTRTVRHMRRSAAWALWRTSALRRSTVQKLQAFHNRHAGERCFIVGNGPSLAKMDLSPLRGETTIGTNRVYLAADDLHFQPTYYACVNELVLQQCGHEIQQLAMPKFLSWPGRRHVNEDDQTMFLRCLPGDDPGFSSDPAEAVWIGGTVTYVAMQLAWYMGFAEVILIGVDHRFDTTGPANETVVSPGEDPNHFSPDYFPDGFAWQLPDLQTSERAYRLARERFEATGRSIVDSTVDGALDVFPKVEYSELF